MKRINRKKKKKKSVNRYKVLTGIALIAFGAILVRLLYLQIFDYDNLRAKADIRSTRFMSQQAPRGKIYSSDGDILATNQDMYMLNFTKTSDGMKSFYNTINTVFTILKENNAMDKLDDNFNLEIDKSGKLYFDFPVSESDTKLWNAQKLRFMYDRGLEDAIEKKLFPKSNGNYTKEQINEVNKELLSYTPEQTFDILVKQYGLYNMLNIGKDLTDAQIRAFNKKYEAMTPSEITAELLKSYNLTQIRDFMLVRDDMKLQSYSGFKPITIASNIGQQVAYIFYQKETSLPGIEVEKKPVRYYPYGTLASHVLGYMGAIPAAQSNKYASKGYDVSSDLVGVSGIESAFENVLRGRTGGDVLKVNSAGQKVGTLSTLEAYPGDNVHLTINADMQYSATKMLQTQMDYIQKNEPYGKNARMGAVVAVDVNTGAILAMASLPNYNPNDFATGKVSTQVVKKYFNPDITTVGQEFIKMMGLNKTLDEMFPEDSSGNRQDKYDVIPKPLFNYATMGLVPPGSTFKPVTATASLETGATNATYTVTDSPSLYYHADPNIFGNNLPKDNDDHGVVDIVKAIQVSCNNYFYNMAAKIYYQFGKSTEALDVIANYAAKFGLGVMPGTNEKPSTGIEIPEKFGNSYNFEDFKSSSIYYSKWTLVEALNKGQFDAVNIAFAPIDIAADSKDSKAIADAKTNIKTIITNQMQKIGKEDIRTNTEQDAFVASLNKAIKQLYDVSPTVKSSIDSYIEKNPKYGDVNTDINNTARAINAWVVYTMYTTITTPAQLGYSAIGQGTNEFTPLQLAGYVATLANGGTRYKLHLVDEITNPTGQVVEKVQPEVLDKVDISKQNLDLIKQGMYNVNNNPHGTGYFVFGEQGFPIPTAGKTGTASLTSSEHDVGRSAWGVYISFAPVEKPQIAVVVVIYNGIHGYLGAPVARAVYETYFRDEIKSKYPNYQPKTMSGEPYSYTLNPPLPKITGNNEANSNNAAQISSNDTQSGDAQSK
ncbi:MAG: penicillin-binding transpeptidase domain-containing protein [Sarcina sp.]